MLYLPPGCDHVALTNAELPLIITEGEFKTLALARLERWKNVEADPASLPLQRAARGEEVRGDEQEVRFADGSSMTLLGHATPLRDTAGRVIGAVAAGVDITERKRAEEGQELLARELSHRIKNIFTVIGGMVTLSASGTPGEVRNFAANLRRRLNALAIAHEYVRPQSGEGGPPSNRVRKWGAHGDAARTRNASGRNSAAAMLFVRSKAVSRCR